MTLAIKSEDMRMSEREAGMVNDILHSFTLRVATSINEMDGAGVDYRRFISPLDCRRRDGFIPYSHNKGGYEIEATLHSLQVLDFGFENEVDEHREFLKGLLTQKEQEQSVDDIDDAIDRLDDEPMGLIYLQVMLHDDMSVHIKLGVYFSDAPYFRHKNEKDHVKEFVVNFTNSSDLIKKLAKIEHRVTIDNIEQGANHG